MKKISYILTAILATTAALANTVTTNHVTYQDNGDGTASVIGGDESFTGTLIIADTVTISGSNLDVTSIGNDAFAEGGLLDPSPYKFTGITIGNNVTSIGSNAFRECTSLRSVTLPDSLTSIGSRAFRSCTSLSTVIFEGSPPSVGNDTFSNIASGAQALVLPQYAVAGQFGTPGSTWNGLTVVTKLIDTIAHENGNLVITPFGGTGSYTVEETADLTSGIWITISPTVTNGAFQLPTTHTHRYYRFTN